MADQNREPAGLLEIEGTGGGGEPGRALNVEAFARFVGSEVWHPIVNVDKLESACGITFTAWPPDSYEVRPAHNSTTIDRCSVCRSEIATSRRASSRSTNGG